MTLGPSSLADLVVDAALQLNNRALRALADRRGLLSEADIHLLRVTVKRLRALWQLVRNLAPEGEYAAARQRLKCVHQSLRAARDVTVITETLERLCTRMPDPAAQAALLRCVSGISNDLVPTVLGIPLGKVSEWFQEESRVWREMPLPDESRGALLKGYTRCYRKGRRLSEKALDGANGEVLHELRHWAKVTLHQFDVIKAGLGDSSRARRWYIARLGDTLGVHNDCAMLLQRLPEFSLKRQERASITSELETRMCSTRARAMKVLPHVYRDSPREFRETLRSDIERLALDGDYALRQSA